MSNYKEGEGSVKVDSFPFTSYDIKPDQQYIVLVLAGNDVVIQDRAKASRTGHPPDAKEEFMLHCLDGETVMFHHLDSLFMTHYEEHFDVIIKDLESRTIKMLPNVTVLRNYGDRQH